MNGDYPWTNSITWPGFWTWPTWPCDYWGGCPCCAPRCPCCGRPLYRTQPYITWTVNGGVGGFQTVSQAAAPTCDGQCSAKGAAPQEDR